jgi:hypothetical protein
VAWTGSLNGKNAGLRIQRLVASGAIAPGWPDTGWKARPVISANSPLQTAPDGIGGLLVAGTLISVGPPFVQRIRGDTTVATGWPATGLLLSSGTGNPLAPVRLVRSDANHFIAAWVRLEGTQVVECQRFSLAGSLDPARPANGVRLDSLGSGNQNSIILTCVEDGAGGVVVGWGETTRYRVRHIRADGIIPGATPTAR